MIHLLTALCRSALLTPLFFCFIFSYKAFSQTCNNWLNTPSQPSWVNAGDIDVPGNQLTVEALINIKGVPPGGVIQGLDVVSKHTGPANVNYLLRSSHAELSTTNGYFYTTDGCDLEMNKTYHVAMVYNGVSLKYYRNGFLLGETPATGNMIQNDLPTGIGFISTLIQAENFIGFINEVRIWNVARTQAQIRANMNIPLVNPPTQTGLRAYYTFNSLLNKQGNAAFNGTLVGAAAINQTNPNCVFVADTCAVPSPCQQTLSLPTHRSRVTVGDLDVTGNQLTVEAMFNRSPPLNNGLYYGHLVSKHTNQFNVNYSLLPNGCEITTSVSGYKAIFQTCMPDLGKTYHIAMVYDGATLKFYRNGFLMSQTACTGNMVTNDLLTTIGQVGGGTDPFDNQFLGYTNEVRIWSVARTQTQLATYMNQSLPNPTTQVGLRGYYSFNDLKNKQGNAAFNGTLHGDAAVRKANPDCSFVPSSCNTVPDVIPNFTIPDTVCVGAPVNISNFSLNATNYYWNFCTGSIDKTPVGTNLGTMGNLLRMPVFMDYTFYNGNYYGFLINFNPGSLIRLNFGNSLLNIPTITNLGNLGGLINFQAEGIQVVYNEGRWYAIVVAGDSGPGLPPRIMKVDFGPDLTNVAPVFTNWGNIGNLQQPVDLHVFEENGNWYGLTVNAENNTITRFNFTNSFNNAPTAVNLGNIGNLAYPTGIYAINDNNTWRVFVTNAGNNSRINGTWSLTRLDFGTSLLNTPTGVNLGNPGGLLKHPRDLTIMKFCGETIGFAVNGGSGSDDIIKIDFNNDLASVPVITSLGNIGNLNFPHSIAKIFRVGPDLYTFVTNVNNNTLTRLEFRGCTNSSISNSSSFNPPAVTYTAPGIYNINLSIDDGLPTQSSVCKQVVVKSCDIVVDPPDVDGCGGFQETLGGQAYDRAFDVAATTNNEFYVAGVSRSFSASDDILITRLTATGAIIWSKTFGNARDESVRKITPTADGGLLVVGQTKSFNNINGDILCMKIDGNGNLLWSKVLGLGSGNGDLGMDIIETTDGGYAVSGIINVAGGVADAVITKLDNAVNIVWSKRFDRGDGEDGVGILQKLDTLVVAIDLQNATGHYELVLMKLKLVDGDFIMSAKVTPAARGLFNSYIFKDPLQPGYIISAHTIDNSNYANMKHTIVRVDDDFNIRRSQLVSIDPVTNDYYTGLAVLPDGSIISTASSQTNADGYIYRLNENNTGVFVKRFNAPTDRRLYRVAVSGQQLMAVGGAVNNGQEDFFVTSFGINGVLGANCNVEDTSLIIDQPGYTVSPFSWPTISDVVFPAVGTGLNSVHQPLSLTDLCPSQKPDFSYKQSPCTPKTIEFSTNLTNIESYEWSFGDGQTSVGQPNPSNNYANFGNYVVKLRIKTLGGCLDSIQKLISVNLLFENIILTKDTTICSGSTKQLVTVPSLSFCWTPTTYLSNPNIANPITSTPQDITYYFTAEVTGTNVITNGNFSAGNAGFTSQYNFVTTNITEGQYFVGNNPAAWNGSLSACKDHTTGNGNMMLVNGSPTPNVNVWTQTVTVTPNTNYAFSTWIQALYPPNPAQLQFSINGKDAGALITASLPTCTWTQFYTTWNSGNSTTAQIAIVNKNTAVQGNDFALDDISFAPVFIKRDSVVIKVERPAVKTNNDTTICAGGTVQLNATGAQTYVWSPAAGLSNTTIANPVANVSAVSQYIVAGTTLSGCIAKDTVNISLFTKPAINTSNDTLVCKGGPVQLFASGGLSYTWSPAATLSNPAIANPVASPIANTKYYVMVKDLNTCEFRDSVQVTVRPDPVFAVNTPSPVCRFDSAQLVASGGNTYVWQMAEGLSNITIANPKVSPSVTTDYSVTITENTCNQSATLTARVTIKPLPVVDAAKANDIDCRNDRSQLTASGANQYVWTPGTGLTNSGISNPVATPQSTTQYIVMGTAANGCSAKDTIDVNVLPKATIVTANDTTVCKNTPAQLFVTGGTSYSWSPAATLNNPLIANPVVSPLANTKYYVVIRDAINCEYLDSIEVAVRPAAVFSVNAPTQVCKDGSVQLNASGGDTYSWLPAGSLNNAGIGNPLASPAATTDYSVTITENTCNETTTLTTRVTLLPSLLVNATKSNDIDCSNDRSQLAATGATQYVWTPGTTLTNPAIANPVATPAATTEYIVEGINAAGCKGYDTITVKVDNVNKSGYLMPNAFTPNGDGLNDCYGTKYWGIIDELEFSIYNRWGERIFFSKNPGQCWDGTYKGVRQDGGVYVYMIKAKTNCQSEVFRKGTFVLVR